MDLSNLTIKKINQALLKKEFSVYELTKIFLENIKKEDKKIFSFLQINDEMALEQAKTIDEKILIGKKINLLSGIPCAIKDNILVEGMRCTAASKILKNYTAPYDATVIKKLKENDAIILGKTNLDEFAMGSSTEYSFFGPTKNPIDNSFVPGGSSGGSAAAVAANFCVFALGSDTGGSIRQPAAFCGLVGFKPTYGAVSRYGLIAFASSLDQIGPITKTVEDAMIVFDAIKGKDVNDATSLEILNDFSQIEIKKVKIGIPKEYFIKGIDPAIEDKVRKTIKKYENMGAKIEEISLPHTEYALPCYYIIAPAEASSNLARYDGLKYGFSEINNKKHKESSLLEIYFKNRGEGFGSEVRRRIILGTFTLSSGYFEAYYQRAQKVRSLIKQDFEKVFQNVDFIITPTAPTFPFKLGEKLKDPILMYISDILTVAVNLAGLPAISLPTEKTEVKNFSPSFQIIGPPFSDYKILKMAQIYES